ncbi:MAG: glycosyltransferase [Pseudonocardiaceae bacterium]|nr:glycosyltransferase [Pseudonocardiaceae bacterium]
MNLLRRAVRRTGPLRVLYVVPDLRVGGAERHVTTLLPALDRTRFTPSALCIGQQGALFGALAEAGVPSRALGRTKQQFLLTLAGLVRQMRRSRPDIVITRGYNAEMLGRIAAMLARVPRTIVWVHHCGDLAPRSRLRRLADRLLEPATSAYYGVAHGQVPYLTGDLGYPAAKIRVVPNGTDPTAVGDDPTARRDPAIAATLGIGPDDPVVGILAALRPEKDHTTLLRAARLVTDDIPGTRVLIVGDGALRPELQRLAVELGIGDRVLFAGNRSDVGDLLRVMDVFTLSSTTVECAPMALLEAMATARPAVCTAVGGIPDIIVDGVTGYLVPPRDPRALADRLVPLLRDPERARLMGKAARQRLEAEFTLEGSLREAQRALEETAGRISPGRISSHPAPSGPVRLTVVLDRISLGGAETLLLNLLSRLDPALVSPRVVCLREGGPLAADFRAAGIPVDVLDRTGRFDPRTVPRLLRHFRRHRTQAVLVTHHHRAALTLGRIAARLARVPANIVAAHDMDLTAVGKRCLPRHDVETLFLSSALVLLTPRQGDYLHREEGIGRYPWRRLPEVVIPNGIPLPPVSTPDDRARARTDLGLGPDDFVVGIVARLAAQKAHHVLFEAVARLAPSHPRLRLVVVGDGVRAAELASLAHRLGIADRVRFTGARRDVPRLLPGFDVSCLSSVHEGVPITVIESMAAGVPVVATDCGALRDMVTDGEEGFIVPVGDAAALADRIATLAADRQLRARLGARGRCRAERDYRIERTAAGFEHLLTSLVPDR